MKKTTIVLAILLAAAASYAAVNDSASIIFPILDMGAGARSLGMGEAFTAVADDSSAIYWNPAGLGTIKKAEAALTYNKWYMDTMFSQFLFAFPLSTGAIGAYLVYMNLGEVPMRDTYGVTSGSVYPYIAGGSIGYGLSFGNISAGASIKLIGQSTGSKSDMAFAADAGALFKTGIFSAGLSLQNAGSGGAYSLPINIKGGVAVKILNSAQHMLLVAVDSQYLFKDAFSLSAGAEYVFMELLAVRAGYKAGFGEIDLEGFKGISGGLGVKIAGVNIDYAIVPYGDLGITHRVTLSYVFGNNTEPKHDEAMNEKTQAKSAVKAKAKQTQTTTE